MEPEGEKRKKNKKEKTAVIQDVEPQGTDRLLTAKKEC